MPNITDYVCLTGTVKDVEPGDLVTDSQGTYTVKAKDGDILTLEALGEVSFNPDEELIYYSLL